MLEDWLQERDRSDPPTYLRFGVAEITEVDPPTGEGEAFLRAEIAVGRSDPAFVRDAAEGTGWETVCRLFMTGQLTTIQARRGHFGEIVSVEKVRDLRGNTISVMQYRFAPHPNVSPPARDILALRVAEDGEVAEVSLIDVELDVRKSRARDVSPRSCLAASPGRTSSRHNQKGLSE